jgi:hypothetical protein
VNPGIEGLFAALSQEAKRYDRYEFEYLAFHFVGTTVITTTTGQIGLAFDPNPNSADPDSQAKFSAYEAHDSSSVYKPDGLWLNVPREMLRGRRFVRCGPVGSDLSLYDPGRLIVMVRDEASAASIGYVEVHYRVRFTDFHLEPSAPIPHGLSGYNLSSGQSFTTATAAAVQFDENIVDGLELTNNSGVLTLPCGQYKVRVELLAVDTANELFIGSAQLQKNNAALSPPITTSLYCAGTAAGEAGPMVLSGYVTSDGTDTIRVWVTLTGAAGTLTIAGDAARIFVEAIV